jgi:synaptobrevin homolog YKT6
MININQAGIINYFSIFMNRGKIDKLNHSQIPLIKLKYYLNNINIMVRIYSVSVMNYRQTNMPENIYSAYELSDFGFFKRPTIKELCTFASCESIKRSTVGQKTSLEYQTMKCYTYVSNSGLAIACVTDFDYPARVASDFLINILNAYSNNQSEIEIDVLLQKYQDVSQVDKLSAIKKELNDTTKICSDTINKLLIRDEEMQDLLKKTEDLSETTKIFVIETDKMNGCCNLF